MIIVNAPEQENVLSDYHEEIEKYFSNKQIKIPTLPSDLKTDIANDYFAYEIGSASQYYEYLQKQIDFWKENDPQNKLSIFSHISSLTTALSEFNDAIRYSKTDNPNNMVNMRNLLNASTNRIKNEGSLFLKLQFTEFILTFKDKSQDYISGVKLYFQKNRPSNLPNKIDTLDGYFAAMEYARVLESYRHVSEEALQNFKNNIELASANYGALNESYTTSFREQQRRLQSIQDQTNNHFNNFEKNNASYFEAANKRVSDLEYLYGEKLRLSKPAEYWAKLKKSYSIKGYVWFGVSGLFAVAIIALLLVVLIKDIIIFSPEANWIENLKNSAIITVIASIGIYILRLTTKMGLSSHHLADDARERENLSYFYLSLIEKGAVTDKERALVLNALFSRSDTGLLKGESTPSMPSNISDIIDVIKSNKQ